MAKIDNFGNLNVFELSGSAITTLESDIPWPETLTSLTLADNLALAEIQENAFLAATGLQRLALPGSSADLVLQENALHIKAKARPELVFSAVNGTENNQVVEARAFGIGIGGEIFGRIVGAFPDFPELAFRLMLKSHFDKGTESKTEENL